MLKDVLKENLDVVFCGTAKGKASALKGYYYSGPNNKFYNILHSAGFTVKKMEPTDCYSGQLLLKNGISPPNTLLNYPIAPIELIWPNDYFDAFTFIENTILNLSSSYFPLEISHFIQKISLVKLNLENHSSSVDNIRELASLFIRLFDTLPIYESVSKENILKWTELLKAKKLAGLLVSNDLHKSLLIINEIIRWKNNSL